MKKKKQIRAIESLHNPADFGLTLITMMAHGFVESIGLKHSIS